MNHTPVENEHNNKGPISKEDADKLINNYKDNKKKHLDRERHDGSLPPDDKGETTAVWFDAAFCKTLIEDLQAGDKGLRVYFGAYDKNHSDKDKKNKMTVVLVTTTGSATEPEKAVDDWKMIKAFTGGYNEGHLCPPKCNPPV